MYKSPGGLIFGGLYMEGLIMLIIGILRYFLGLNKRKSNVFARNEVGQTSLKPTIYLNILKFWQHVEELPGKSIVACVAIVCVWFRRKERPRNGILGFGRSFAWAILTFVPRSLLLNRKETLATQAKSITKQCLMYIYF